MNYADDYELIIDCMGGSNQGDDPSDPPPNPNKDKESDKSGA